MLNIAIMTGRLVADPEITVVGANQNQKYHFASSIVSPPLNKIQKYLWQPRHKSNTAVPRLTLHIDNVDGNHIFTDLISSQGHQFANPRFQPIDIEFTF